MLEPGERPLAPQWHRQYRDPPAPPCLQKKKSNGRCREALAAVKVSSQAVATTTTTTPTSICQETRAARRGQGYCPKDLLDERGPNGGGGSKELRRTHSESHCYRRRGSRAAAVIAAGGSHTRSQSAMDFVSGKQITRRVPDCTFQTAPGSFLSEGPLSTRQSLSQTGRSSRLADLPECRGFILRHSPESLPDSTAPTVTDFSRLIDSHSPNEDVDAAEIQRIQLEQSKKLIPMIQAKSTPRGHRSSRSPLTPLGKRSSPITNASNMLRMESNSMATSFGNAQKNEWRSESGHLGRTSERNKLEEQDRDSFFRSLKNKSVTDKEDTCDVDASLADLVQDPSVVDCCSCNEEDSSAVVSIDCTVIPKKKEDSSAVCVVPPSVEEERFLRSLGWDDTDEVDFLTDEEIAAFKAQYLNKAVQAAAAVKGNDDCNERRHGHCKKGHLRGFQCSPVGHLSSSSFDLATDASSSEYGNSDTASF